MVQGLDQLRSRSSFPEIEDLDGAAVALVRLQDIYKLNMTTLPLGHFTGVGQQKQGNFRKKIIQLKIVINFVYK